MAVAYIIDRRSPSSPIWWTLTITWGWRCNNGMELSETIACDKKALEFNPQHSEAYISLGHIIGGTIMDSEQVVVKRIVSPDGKNIAEVKSSAKVSGDGKTKISQSFSVKVSSDQNSSSSSQSGSSSISCTDGNNSSSSS